MGKLHIFVFPPVESCLNVTEQFFPRNAVHTMEKRNKKKPLHLDGISKLNMERETWIAVDGYDFPIP